MSPNVSRDVMVSDAAPPARTLEEQPSEGIAAARCPPAPRVSRDGWLSPFTLSTAALDQSVPAGRASNTGCLPMPLTDYCELLNWTCRQLRSDKRGAMDDLPPFLQRLAVNIEGCLELMRGVSCVFRRAAGRPEALRRHAEKWGRQRPPGVAPCSGDTARPQ